MREATVRVIRTAMTVVLVRLVALLVVATSPSAVDEVTTLPALSTAVCGRIAIGGNRMDGLTGTDLSGRGEGSQ